MLPRYRRIERKNFGLISSGKRLNTAIFSLSLVKLETINPSKFSFSVSKKVAKGAVLRNKLRRRGYASIERNLNNIKTGYYLFFTYKNGSSTASYNEIEKNILELLSKSFVLK